MKLTPGTCPECGGPTLSPHEAEFLANARLILQALIEEGDDYLKGLAGRGHFEEALDNTRALLARLEAKSRKESK